MPASTRLDPLAAVEEKVAQGERLSADDGVALFESSDLVRIGRLADRVRRQKVGDDVYFVVNRHINYTNVCRNRCRFCAFSREEGEPGAYTLTVDEVLAKAREGVEQGATEIHIVGGEHPSLPYASVRAMISGIRDFAPAVHIKAFTASEIVHFAEAERVSVEDMLGDLKAAGLDSLPGGGAEILAARVREQVCPAKISGERWLEVHQLAHRLGLKTNATMLYGHVESLRRPGRSPAPAPRRLKTPPAASRLSSPWLSSPTTVVCRTCPPPPGSTTSRRWRSPVSCWTISLTSRPTGS